MGTSFMDMANLVENSLDDAPARKKKDDPAEPREDKRSAWAVLFVMPMVCVDI